ncbi:MULTISPECIES: ABC transporter ATP-binding protein [Aerococcus]|uniref:ABC transporter ATP-binding protein n=1 Tax=Aerococcus sanguinicola TaxID=119206 RepID=A0A5N1GK21_9LACT|nr:MULTISPECIES: ABC transporter ATP-binding protein [Aerococcus]KAA9301152.1 ABC transporter ATP-binding protein [Aerococcus sanguinicola]MDK6369319.1 ABC transporter ATP-binding protein [Aerococcus sp. UMB9870]MDK6679144.1 ABC transporter ATP-binding protein [Aerococcus sp. UMB8608]MDK6941127.1 ABC transporter ATP-binding protein [Aerococcus sp. UMB8487]OFK13532.1 ABC transporter ATP-binding protein [Aerococcus sp. HMSC072A12]
MQVFAYLRAYRWRILLVILLTFGNALGELFLPKLMSTVVDQGVANGDTQLILRIGGVMLLVVLITVLCRGSAAYHSAKAAMGFSRDVRHQMYTKVNHMTFDETEDFGISSLITRTTDDVNQIEQMALMGMRPWVRGLLMFVGGLIMALTTNLRLSFVIFLSLPLILIGTYIVFRVALPYFPKLQAYLDRINLLFRQRLTGLRVIRAFSRNHYEEEIFSQANEDYYQTALRVNRIMITVMPLLTIILNFSLVGVAYFGSHLIDQGDLQIGDMMAYLQYITQVLSALIMISHLLTMLPRTFTSAQRVNELLTYPTREIGGQVSLKEPIQRIEARDLTFYYPGANLPALKAINFSVERGQTLGIIGGTGSGKSTLLKLLLQFYDPSSGHLLINNQEIEDLEAASVRDQMSYVPQQNFFFTKSIRDNLSYSNEAVSDDQLLNNLSIAQARDFLPEESPLDEAMIRGGNNFSGGQRQRLAIARALSRQVPVYIFDDSFSALDYQTDYELRQALQEALDQAILIIVAQRVATIRHADKILVLDNGQVKGFGSHEDLLINNQIYREIALSQGEEAVDHA